MDYLEYFTRCPDPNCGYCKMYVDKEMQYRKYIINPPITQHTDLNIDENDWLDTYLFITRLPV